MDMGWYPDPLGRFQERYHNGKRWTLQVNDGGAAFTDTTDDQRAGQRSEPVTEVDAGDASESTASVTRFLVVVVGLVLFAAAMVFLAKDDDSSPRATARSTTTPTATPSWEQKCPGTAVFIEYRVLGSTRQASITYSTPGGGSAQQSDIDVPLQSKSGGDAISGCFGSREFLYLSAQNSQASGTVFCTITRDGQEIARVQSSGAYVIATCSP